MRIQVVVQFGSQLAHEDAKVLHAPDMVSAPDGFEQGFVRHWQTGMSHQMVEQGEFLGCQTHRNSRPVGDALSRIQPDFADRDAGFKPVGANASPAQSGSQPRCKFGHVERSHQTLIGACLQHFRYLVRLLRIGQHQKGDTLEAGPKSLASSYAVVLSPLVKEDDVEFPDPGKREGLFGMLGIADIETRVEQVAVQSPTAKRITIDDQDSAL